MAKEIPLTNSSLIALVDDEDYERISSHKWQLHQLGYAHRCQYLWYDKHLDRCYNHDIKMHREILGVQLSGTPEVDHINRNKLDNRKQNLRFATRQQNVANKGPLPRKTGKYKGTTLRENGKWRARLAKMNLGTFDTESEAAKAYDRAAVEKYGEYAYVNFSV